MTRTVRHESLPVIGWREWVGLPELGIPAVKAKIDTGARTSALHAVNVERFQRRGEAWVRFEVHPHQRDLENSVIAEAAVIDERTVRNSGGHAEHRPVIKTQVEIGESVVEIELTLTNRALMGFRMLLGREAVRHRFLVDPGDSFLHHETPPEARVKKAKKKKKSTKQRASTE
ncbi:MAG: ATP-dependent zinc protease [Myxococcales bacterium]|nr:ATP-dependent zinc protease [Myxococcales bacterium]